MKGNYQRKQYQTTIPVIDPDVVTQCTSAGQYNKTIEFCAGLGDGNDTCQGDSGGPATVLDTTTGIYTQVGVVSYTPESPGSTPSFCGSQGMVGVYGKVSAYVPWIESYTGALPSVTTNSPTTTQVSGTTTTSAPTTSQPSTTAAGTTTSSPTLSNAPTTTTTPKPTANAGDVATFTLAFAAAFLATL